MIRRYIACRNRDQTGALGVVRRRRCGSARQRRITTLSAFVSAARLNVS